MWEGAFFPPEVVVKGKAIYERDDQLDEGPDCG
jgi:hypothetical protein